MEKVEPPSRALTTGLLAAAAAKGAARIWAGEKIKEVSLVLSSGKTVAIPLSSSRCGAQWGEASVLQSAKEAGPLRGVEIAARVTSIDTGCEAPSIRVEGGTGVGVITRTGFSVPVGAKAINPGPVKMIRAAVEEALGETPDRKKSFLVSISVPNGEAIARRTLNPSFGVVGGISILGEGTLAPHWKGHQETIRWAIQRAKALGFKEVVLKKSGTGLASEETVLVGRHGSLASQIALEEGIGVRG
jgi:cobalt-precorrin-5B (C1)-methyltransferase